MPRRPTTRRKKELIRRAELKRRNELVGRAVALLMAGVAAICFRQFVEIFKRAGTLEDTIHCKVEEQVAIFLHIVAHNQRVRTIRACASRSRATVSTYFNKVLKAILGMQDFFIKPPTGETPLQIEGNPRWMPYFKDCIGAIDGDIHTC
ncbi:uncharacterized protein LOC143882915 [Tasmannia lanceolata]|uniref:uncharacterized protein LOC143882915 n=1 Tax=Tasmannia lanceolata TaxID=3420 RepID=UPI004062E87B